MTSKVTRFVAPSFFGSVDTSTVKSTKYNQPLEDLRQRIVEESHRITPEILQNMRERLEQNLVMFLFFLRFAPLNQVIIFE